IVVIENIQRFLHETALPPREAALAAMQEVAGAVVATSLVLIAVFAPVAFFPGTTGRIYKQFSLTIAFAVAISAFCALTLTPALSAIVLRARAPGRFARFVDRVTARARAGYGRVLARTLRHPILMAGAFAVALALTVFALRRVPTGFVPEEDQGYFIVSVQGPDSASLEETERVMNLAEAIVRRQPETANTFAIAGFNFAGSAANKGLMFASLRPYSKRKGRANSAAAVEARVRGPLASIPEAIVLPFSPPSIQGIGTLGGFQFEVLDGGGAPLEELGAATRSLVARANADPALRGIFTPFSAGAPQLVLDVDRDKAKAMRVGLDQVFGALGVYIGSEYVNDFDLANRAYRVVVQADARDRAEPRQIGQLYVRSDAGAMIPLGGVLRMREAVAPPVIDHFNLYRSAEIDGSPSAATSTGTAITRVDALAREVLQPGMVGEWTGIAREEIRAGGTALVLFALGVLVVFLVLAAQYESFALPLVVLFSVPIAVLGALVAIALRGLVNDVFCQVGLLMLVGLASKNAILIVELARRTRGEGKESVPAVISAAETRLRPILMTSFAFILGVLPLVFATGAGSASRHSLGTAVFGGMIASTLLNLLIVPTLYVIVDRFL
ncbi:MAG: efflux RND transporter permease subunit, partial [Polyangiaceae bacterium]